MSFDWTRDDQVILVELYKKYPVLYSLRSYDYGSRMKKRMAYEQLTEELSSQVKKEFSVEEIKSKIMKLRSQFMENYNKEQASDQPYQPSWFLYDRLKFILPHIVHRSKRNYDPKLPYELCLHDSNEGDNSVEAEQVIWLRLFFINSLKCLHIYTNLICMNFTLVFICQV